MSEQEAKKNTQDVEAVAVSDKDANNSDIDEISDEEITFDEPSDSEDFMPPKHAENDESSDESCSSGEEEEGVHVQSDEFGGVRFSKLVFDDVEAKKKSQNEESDDEDKENQKQRADEDVVSDNAGKGIEKTKLGTGSPFKTYRTASILDEDMEENYKSDEDDTFDPVYCGESLSDIEYVEGDDRDTESEPETEEIGGKHKRTGEALISIKMIEELKIPPEETNSPPDEACKLEDHSFTKLDSSMECS